MLGVETSQEIRRRAELQCAEIIGRLNACEYLENGIDTITDSRVLYGALLHVADGRTSSQFSE